MKKNIGKNQRSPEHETLIRGIAASGREVFALSTGTDIIKSRTNWL
jgi:hypothetical protein